MRKIKDYKIISKTSLSSLENVVKQRISEGWQPLGNILYIPENEFNDNAFWVFSMVKYMEKL